MTDFELTRDGSMWVATHVDTGVASHGESPNEAVAMAAEAVVLHQQDHSAGDEDYQQEMLERFDIDPEAVEDENLDEVIGAEIAIQHIDSADQALNDLSDMDFEQDSE